MCKYCNFKHVNEYVGEKTNENTTIKRIRDGSHVIDLTLNRYHNDDGYRAGELIVDQQVSLPDGLYTVNQATIKIKYCPFCGEEL